MTYSENISKQLIKDYITLLSNSYSLRELQSEKALKILFEKIVKKGRVFLLPEQNRGAVLCNKKQIGFADL
jgi:hypothetical protein